MSKTERVTEMLQILKEKGYDIEDLIGFFGAIASEEEKTSNLLEKRVSKILRKLGAQPNLIGYKYLKTAICIAYRDEFILKNDGIMVIYQKLAKRFSSEKKKVTASQVEGGIRTVIENLFKNGNPEYIYNFLGENSYYFKGKPTNAEFIASIAEYMRMEDL